MDISDKVMTIGVGISQKQALRKFLWAAQNNDVNNNVLSLYILYNYVMFRPSTF